MSSEFIFYRCSTQLVEAIEQFGRPAFDLFWDGDLIDENEIWTKKKIKEIFSVEERDKFDDLLGDLCLPILIEGQEASEREDGRLSINGDFIEGVHFLLAGKRQFTHCDFLTKKVLLDLMRLSSGKIILVNLIKGGHKIERGDGPDATLLRSDEIEEIIDALKIILDDDFEARWKFLKEYDRDSSYGSNYEDPKWAEAILATCRNYYHKNRNILTNVPDFEDPKWAEDLIKSSREFAGQYRERLDYRHSLSFREFFYDSNKPKRFIEQDLLPLLQNAANSDCGILTAFCN